MPKYKGPSYEDAAACAVVKKDGTRYHMRRKTGSY